MSLQLNTRARISYVHIENHSSRSLHATTERILLGAVCHSPDMYPRPDYVFKVELLSGRALSLRTNRLVDAVIRWVWLPSRPIAIGTGWIFFVSAVLFILILFFFKFWAFFPYFSHLIQLPSEQDRCSVLLCSYQVLHTKVPPIAPAKDRSSSHMNCSSRSTADRIPRHGLPLPLDICPRRDYISRVELLSGWASVLVVLPGVKFITMDIIKWVRLPSRLIDWNNRLFLFSIFRVSKFLSYISRLIQTSNWSIIIAKYSVLNSYTHPHITGVRLSYGHMNCSS
jgi:hypothetical protein